MTKEEIKIATQKFLKIVNSDYDYPKDKTRLVFKVRNRVIGLAEEHVLLDNFEDSINIISLFREKCLSILDNTLDRIIIEDRLNKSSLNPTPLYLNFYREPVY